MQENVTIKKTGDGSDTLYHQQLDETYHSTHGALTESQHVFIKEGLDFMLQRQPEAEELHILEAGFGTGLNAVLALAHVLHRPVKLHYLALETFPLSIETIKALNYRSLLSAEVANYLLPLHQADWEAPVPVTDNFTLEKRKGSVHELQTDAGFDLVFYDAFAPRKQPEMWTVEYLRPVCEALKPGGLLVTYCSMGQFRRNLKVLGMQPEKIPGPPGKREMTRASR